MRTSLLVLGAFALVACRTHEVDECFGPCEDDDTLAFGQCVAYGAGDCAAGNRRCCALAQECLGMLDDQNVVTTRPMCEIATADSCFPPCGSMEEIVYESCLSVGGETCAAGDVECCALEQNCLGDLGDDVTVVADGCCSTSDDCAVDETCSIETWECVADAGTCGDGTVESGEACDPGPTPVLDCNYGESACVRCDARCAQVSGIPHFCGDGVVDSVHGESCDPPNGATCDGSCLRVIPPSCRDGRMTGDETDMDCGGTVCPPCTADHFCRLDRDCTISFPECGATSFCEPAMGLCTETFDCDDFDSCTDDVCEAGTGCTHPTVDDDVDGDPPIACGGGDCDDSDPRQSSIQPEVGCLTGGDGIDNDCNGTTDDAC